MIKITENKIKLDRTVAYSEEVGPEGDRRFIKTPAIKKIKGCHIKEDRDSARFYFSQARSRALQSMKFAKLK